MVKRAGRHPDKALTTMQVRNLKEPGRYADGNGLYLVVDPSGARRWLLRITVRSKRRDIGLGGASIVSLAEAREKAVTYRRIARDGGDPLIELRASRSIVPTFAEAAKMAHEARRDCWKEGGKHVDQWINTLRTYTFPGLGSRPVDQIDTADILKVLAPIWLTKPETARRVRQRLGAVMDWAKASGHRTGDNPVAGVSRALPRQNDRAKHHAAMPYDDVPSFVASLRQRADAVLVALAFEFLILTAARTGEALGATWDEFDEDFRVWTLPAERMKAGRNHRIPLSWRATELLHQVKPMAEDSKFLFPGRDPEKPLSNTVFLMTVRRMDVQTTPHGFRSSFRDWAAEETNFPREVAEAALAHTIKNKVEAAYRRGDLFEKRRAMMEAWAGWLARKQ